MTIVVVPPSGDPPDTPDPNTANPYDELERRHVEQIIHWRERYAGAGLGILQAWVGFVIVITIAQFTLRGLGWGLDKSEFIAVVTTTTGSVVLLAHIVGKYLFPERGPNMPWDRR